MRKLGSTCMFSIGSLFRSTLRWETHSVGESTYVGVEVRCVYVGLFSVCVSGQRSAVETHRVSRESTYVEAEPGRVYRFVLVSGKHEDAPRTHAHQGSSNDAPARVGVVCEFHYVFEQKQRVFGRV